MLLVASCRRVWLKTGNSLMQICNRASSGIWQTGAERGGSWYVVSWVRRRSRLYDLRYTGAAWHEAEKIDKLRRLLDRGDAVYKYDMTVFCRMSR